MQLDGEFVDLIQEHDLAHAVCLLGETRHVLPPFHGERIRSSHLITHASHSILHVPAFVTEAGHVLLVDLSLIPCFNCPGYCLVTWVNLNGSR